MKVSFAFTLLSMAVLGQDNPYGCHVGGVVNEMPVLELEAEVQKEVVNGKMWKMEEGTNWLYILKLQGSPYEMGYAYGQLMGKEINENMENMMRYIQVEVIESLTQNYGLNDLLAYVIYKKLFCPFFWFLLDLDYQVALPYIPQRFIDELDGIVAGGQGSVDAALLRRINMLPELTRASCSIIGAWGPSTPDETLYHFRGLDWDYNAEISQYPSIVIYESNEEGSNTFANIGYLGLIGSITALSKKGISIGEKQYEVPNPDAQWTYFGTPWLFVLRDTAQFANNMAEVQERLNHADRTVLIHLGLGSVPDNTFRGADYTQHWMQYYDDQSFLIDFSDTHPQMDGVFYMDRHPQPDYDPCVGNILQSHWGNITPELIYREVSGLSRTGDTQMCVMDPKGQRIWLTYSGYKTQERAYDRSPMYVDLKQFWSLSEEEVIE